MESENVAMPKGKVEETPFTCKDECLEYCKRAYEPLILHPLVYSRKGSNNYRFTLVCKDCQAPAVSAKCSRKKNQLNTFVITSYGLHHIHPVHGDKDKSCYPTTAGKRKSNLQELTQSEVLNVIVNDVTAAKKSKSVATATKKILLSHTGHGEVTFSAIKWATANMKITPMEHLLSYREIFPYFEQWKMQNPTLAYDIEPKTSGVFERLTVVMPYAASFLPNMLNVFGLDAGFMPEIPLKGIPANTLQDALGHVDLHPVLADRHYVLGNLTLTILTGMTLEHSRVLLGYCLGYGENHTDTQFFLRFFRDNGGARINTPKNVILSDRGACAGPVEAVFPLVIQHYCPKHLERNLQSRKYDKKIIQKFWEARSAKDQVAYEAVMLSMEKMGKDGKGKDAADYLRGIPKWQLYHIVEQHAVLYEIKSDNLVEGMFATLKDSRCLASPIYVAQDIATKALAALRSAEVQLLNGKGNLTERAYQRSLDLHALSKSYKADQDSDVQYSVWSLQAQQTKGEVYSVNTENRTCTCKHWEQSGCPCVHAWAALAPDNIMFDEAFYYEFCLRGRLRAMFTKYRAMSMVSMPDAKNLLLTKTYPIITPKTKLVPLAGQSSKRIRSAGDTAAGGGATLSSAERRKKVACPSCGKIVAADNNRHKNSSTCVRYAKKHKTGSLSVGNTIEAYEASRAVVNKDGSGVSCGITLASVAVDEELLEDDLFGDLFE